MPDFKLPDLGEGVHEGQILRLLVAEGDVVREDQPIMEVETDKAAVEIPSPFAGRVARWHVREQQHVRVGETMVTIGDAAAPASAPKAAMTAAATAGGNGAGRVTPAGSIAPPRRKPASPAVRKLARTHGLDLELVEGSGPGGRILLADVERAAAGGATPAATAGTRAAAPAAPRIEIAPRPAAAPTLPSPPAPEIVGTPGRDEHGDFVREPLSPLRKRVGAVMSEAWRTIPHVTDCDDADVTDLDRLRRAWNESRPPEQRLGLLAFVLHAVARALVRHPIFNAHFDAAGEAIVHRRSVHIALGVQTSRGLVAPAIRDVERRTIPEIDAEIRRLTEKCRAGRFETADAAGATYTISNAGAMGGSRYATPIITPPQVAVLAVGRSRLMPWVVDGAVVPRLIMPLSHSMDHRVIDGALEIAFMRDVIATLENPLAFALA